MRKRHIAGGLGLAAVAGLLVLRWPVAPSADTALTTGAARQPPGAPARATAPASRPPPAFAPAVVAASGGFASPVDAFLETGHRGALFNADGVAIQASGATLAAREPWRRAARRLDGPRASALLAWLLAQTHADAGPAVLEFLVACHAAGLEPALDSPAAQRLHTMLTGSPALPPPHELADMASQAPLPGELRAALQARIGQQPGLAQQWSSLLLQSADAGRAHALSQLAPDDLLWRLAFDPATATSDAARAGALSSLAARDGDAWLPLLLQQDPAPAGLTDLAARWAATALAGQRMRQLAALAESGAFAGPRAPVLTALLRHASDRHGAQALAARLGLPWPP